MVAAGTESRFPVSDDSIVELSLMMSRSQFDALEQCAASEGTSVARFLRRLIQDAVEELPVGAAN